MKSKKSQLHAVANDLPQELTCLVSNLTANQFSAENNLHEKFLGDILFPNTRQYNPAVESESKKLVIDGRLVTIAVANDSSNAYSNSVNGITDENYRKTDIFVLLFSLPSPNTLPDTLGMVRDKAERIKRACDADNFAQIPIVLVGIKADNADYKGPSVSIAERKALTQALQASYMECLLDNQGNISGVFEVFASGVRKFWQIHDEACVTSRSCGCFCLGGFFRRENTLPPAHNQLVEMPKREELSEVKPLSSSSKEPFLSVKPYVVKPEQEIRCVIDGLRFATTDDTVTQNDFFRVWLSPAGKSANTNIEANQRVVDGWLVSANLALLCAQNYDSQPSVLVDAAYRDANAVILLFSLAAVESLNSVMEIAESIKRSKETDDFNSIPIILVGVEQENKLRQISNEQIIKAALKINAEYLDCSLNSPEQVAKIFKAVVQRFERMQPQVFSPPPR